MSTQKSSPERQAAPEALRYEATEKAKLPSEKLESLDATHKKALEQGITPQQSPLETAVMLGNMIDNTETTQKQLFNSLYEVAKKLQDENAQMNWKFLRENMATIGIAKRDGEWLWEIQPKAEAVKPAPAASASTSTTPETATPGKRGEVVQSGKVNFQQKGRSEKENYEAYKNTKITDLYPDAQANDKVEIVRSGKKIEAQFNGSNWSYTEGTIQNVPKNKRDRVRIEQGDVLTYLSSGPRKKTETVESSSPTLGTLEVERAPKTSAEWEIAAQQAMQQQSEQFTQLQWNAANTTDVKNYAKIMREVNERDNQDQTRILIPVPPINPRPQAEKTEKETTKTKEKQKEQAREATMKESLSKAKENEEITTKNRSKILQNEDFKVKKSLREIVDSDELWNHYWTRGNLKGKEQVERGFGLLGVPEGKVRGVLREAINQGTVFTKIAGTSENNVDFEDLLDASNDAKLPIYKNAEGEPSSYDEFVEERKHLKEEYKRADRKEKMNIDARLLYLENIIAGSALVLDGVNKLNPTVSVKKVEQELEQEETRAEKASKTEKLRTKQENKNRKEGKEKGERAGSENSEKVLADFFNPEERGSLEGKLEEDERDIDASDFDALFAKAGAYMALKEECTDKETNKVDPQKLAQKMNELIKEALVNLQMRYFMAKAAETKEKKTVHNRGGKQEFTTKESPLYQPTEALAQRYFGDTEDLDEMAKTWGFNDPDFAEKQMKVFGIKEEKGTLTYLKNNRQSTKRLLEDGFAAEHKREAIPVPKEVTEKLSNQDAKAIIENLEAQSPEFRNLSPEEKRRAAEAVNAFMEKKHTFKKSSLFDINVAKDIDKPLKEWQLGISKEILTIPGIDVQLALGVAVNTGTGEVMLGAILAKDIPVSEQWSANVKAGAGVEVTNPKLFGGAENTFTWMEKAQADSAWRDKIDLSAFLGGSAGFNLTDLRLGFAVGAGFGQSKDGGAQYEKLVTREYLKNGMDQVDAKKETAEKADAIRKMPKLGVHLTKVQEIMQWNDAQLVQFYESSVKGGLEDGAFQAALDNASGLSEWGIGVTVEPLRLLVLAGLIAAGTNPMLTAAVSLAFFGKLGIVVGRTIEVERSVAQGKTEQQNQVENDMMAAIEKRFNVQVEVKAMTYDDMDMVRSREFAGQNLERAIGLPEGRKASSAKLTEFSATNSPEFKVMQEQFKQHGLELGIDEKSKMYSLKPLQIESCKIYLDRTSMAGNGLILNPKGEILVAGSDNLSNLYIKRFDTLYLPGEYEGALKHTIITISSTPNRTMGQITESGAYIELYRDIQTEKLTRSEIVGKQENVMTGAQFNRLPAEKKKELQRSSTVSSQQKEKLQQTSEEKKQLELTERGQKAISVLEDSISLEGLVAPEEFLKNNKIAYRQWTTLEHEGGNKKLEEAIKKENPAITVDQMIVYKEKLFTLSMSEQTFENEDEWLEKRMSFAEKKVYTPYFEGKLADMGTERPTGVTGAQLARHYMARLKQSLQGKSARQLREGESLSTSVGTEGIEGWRSIKAASGQTETSTVREGYDYAQWLTQEGTELDANDRLIARLLLEDHSELPENGDTEAFLRSRLAKKLFYLGVARGKEQEGVANPLAKILGTAKFEKLVTAYEALEKGNGAPSDQETLEAVQSLYEICQQLREAQLGKGVLVKVESARGDFEGRAVLIGGQYFVISTELMSAYFEQCKNPSDLYNEQIMVFSPAVIEQAQLAGAAISSGKSVTVLNESKALSTTAIGITGVATKEFVPKTRNTPPPPPGEEVPETPEPVAGPAPEVSVDEVGPGTNAAEGKEPGQTFSNE